MFETRFFIREYNYKWGYTKAQIDLMVVDQPLISYSKDKPEVSTKKDADDLADKWAKRREEEERSGKKISLSEMFGNNDTKKQDIWQM